MTSIEFLSTTTSSFGLISLAEIGDKSQLVCMALATRHRPWPVLWGASLAFVLLNALAVLFGAGIANWVPEQVMAGIVAMLFAAFGLHALRAPVDDSGTDPEERGGRQLWLTTFLLIVVAEFGDKTQLAVAGLASTLPSLPVWLGATTALIAVSALGVWAGRTVLQRLPVRLLHQLSGGLFLLFALLAAWRALA